MMSRANPTERHPDRAHLAVLAHLREWQRLDNATYLIETAIELALDRYCEGKGPAPNPEEVALLRRLQQMRSGQLRFIQHALRELRAGLEEL